METLSSDIFDLYTLYIIHHIVCLLIISQDPVACSLVRSKEQKQVFVLYSLTSQIKKAPRVVSNARELGAKRWWNGIYYSSPSPSSSSGSFSAFFLAAFFRGGGLPVPCSFLAKGWSGDELTSGMLTSDEVL